MCDENALTEEMQREETLPAAEIIGEQIQESDTEIVPETDDQAQETDTEVVSEEDIPQQEDTAQEVPQIDEQIQDASSEDEEASTRDENPGAEEDLSAAPETKVVPYHERYYLKYRKGKRSTPLDLAGTKAFLQGLGFDGGELKQAREGKDRAEELRNAGKNKNNQMYCSYCGTEIAGVEFFRLPDGRMRCTTCSNTVVKTKKEVEELCRRVLTNMDNFFGATIEVPVSIDVVEERKLKKKIGVPLGTKDSQSMLILGVAINKKKKYSIILENGAPRISLIATFAHELTHIWQYTHWDNNKLLRKCPASKRLLIYEGMAKWAEIQYLYLIGETNVAKREENITRNRQDEYGIGFCLYEDRFPLSREAMSCEDTPFTPDRYPFE